MSLSALKSSREITSPHNTICKSFIQLSSVVISWLLTTFCMHSSPRASTTSINEMGVVFIELPSWNRVNLLKPSGMERVEISIVLAYYNEHTKRTF